MTGRRMRPAERLRLERIREQLRQHRHRIARIIARITRTLQSGKIEALLIGAGAGTIFALLLTGTRC